MVHACNPSSWEAEAEGSPRVHGQPGLHSEFTASLKYKQDFVSKKKNSPPQFFFIYLNPEKVWIKVP